MSNVLNGKSIYDIYGIQRDKRSLYAISKDRYLITKIQSFMSQYMPSRVLKIDVESFYGHIYLIGDYANKKNIKYLISYISSLEDVKHITTYLIETNKRRYCTYSDDISLILQVKTALFQDATTEATNIHVHSVDCTIILVGIVKNDVKKLRAELIAKHISKVQDVKNLLRAIN